jgi:hypothetical protein
MPGAQCSRSLACAGGSGYAREYSQEAPEITRHSPRNGFNAYSALLWDRQSRVAPDRRRDDTWQGGGNFTFNCAPEPSHASFV